MGFLLSIGVDGSDVDAAATALIAAGYKTEKYLLSATRESLKEANVALPVIDVILAHQEELRQLKVLALQKVPEQVQQQKHRNVAEAVFVLYRGSDDKAEAIGTAFAISEKLLLTACHNVVTQSQSDGVSNNVTLDLKVASGLKRIGNAIASEETGKLVKVHKYCVDVDWACLTLADSERSTFSSFIPLATDSSDMPPRGSTEKLYIYHCPVSLFLEDIAMDTCHVMVKEASLGIIGEKTLSFQNGAFPGSCGGPYIFRNKAVALHTESTSTTKTAEDIRDERTDQGRKRKLTPLQVVEMVADSCVSSHTSLGSGIVLHVRTGIMELLRPGTS